MSDRAEHNEDGSQYDVPEPHDWEAVNRHRFGTEWKHPSGSTAKTSSTGSNSAKFLIDGERVFEISNLRTDRSVFWDKVEAALSGWPDNVDAHRSVGNTGLGDFA